MLRILYLFLDITIDHPLKLQAIQLARTSVSMNTQNSYRSTWSKWELFYQQYFGCTPPDNHYRTLAYTQFLDQLLMFVSYCVFELKTNIRSIPRIMSALRYSFLIKRIDCSAFDDPFLRAVKQGVARMPAPPHRVRLPCTLDMINYIIDLNTTPNAPLHNLMLATGISLAYHLCLRSSEYVTKTIVPIDDSHQFKTTEVEFMLNDGSLTLIASNKLHCPYSAIKLVKFSMLHAKNIRRDYGVPIWFSATDKDHQPVPFVQLLFRWATTSTRHDSDPFLSFRANHILHCLLYKTIQSALKSSAKHFNFDEAWFTTHSIRMSVPTIARAAREPTSTILHMGRWKSVPTSMRYQEQSTSVNDHIISIASKPTYFTSEDIILSRTLASRALRSKNSVQKSTSTVRRY